MKIWYHTAGYVAQRARPRGDVLELRSCVALGAAIDFSVAQVHVNNGNALRVQCTLSP